MFEKIYILILAGVAASFLLSTNSLQRRDHIFQPFPGYTFLFGIYFLIGAINVSNFFNVSSFPIDKLWTIFCLAIVGFSLTANGWVRGALVKAPTGKSVAFPPHPCGCEGEDYFYRSFNGVLLALIFVFALAVTLALWVRAGIPLLSSNVDAARMGVASNGYLATLAASLDVAALFAFLFIFTARKRKKDWRFWLSLLVVLSFFIVAVLSGSRSRIFKFIIPAAVAFHFTVRPIRMKWIVSAIPVGVALIGLGGFLRAYSRWGVYLAAGLPAGVGRDMWSQIQYFATIEFSTAIYGLLTVLHLFPNHNDLTYGWLHMGPILAPFQMKIPLPGNYYKELIGGRWDGVGLAATFIAPMYSEGGMLGVLILSMAYGLIIGFLYERATISSKFKHYRVGTYAMFYYTMLSAIRSDFINFDVIWFIALSFGFRIMRNRERVLPYYKKPLQQKNK